MIRPEGMSRPEGTAMQTKPGTDMACDMIRSEGMSRPVGTAMQTTLCRAAHRCLASAVSLRVTWGSFSSRPRAL
jgi:hypothetical protein